MILLVKVTAIAGRPSQIVTKEMNKFINMQCRRCSIKNHHTPLADCEKENRLIKEILKNIIVYEGIFDRSVLQFFII